MSRGPDGMTDSEFDQAVNELAEKIEDVFEKVEGPASVCMAALSMLIGRGAAQSKSGDFANMMTVVVQMAFSEFDRCVGQPITEH